MSDNVLTFTNEEFGTVRTVEIDSVVWFVGKDVAEILGYVAPKNAIISHVDEEDRFMIDGKTRHQISAEFDYKKIGQRGGWVINESGVYSLILSSKLPKAKEFKRWVTSEILPSIRKHGAYMTPETIEKIILNPDYIIKLATALKEEQEKVQTLTEENKILNDTNKALATDILVWTDRQTVNAVIRTLAGRCKISISYMYNWIYKELYNKYGINLKSRATRREKAGGTHRPLLDYLEEKELSMLEATITAICEQRGIKPSELFKTATNGSLK